MAVSNPHLGVVNIELTINVVLFILSFKLYIDVINGKWSDSVVNNIFQGPNVREYQISLLDVDQNIFNHNYILQCNYRLIFRLIMLLGYGKEKI